MAKRKNTGKIQVFDSCFGAPKGMEACAECDQLSTFLERQTCKCVAKQLGPGLGDAPGDCVADGSWESLLATCGLRAVLAQSPPSEWTATDGFYTGGSAGVAAFVAANDAGSAEKINGWCSRWGGWGSCDVGPRADPNLAGGSKIANSSPALELSAACDYCDTKYPGTANNVANTECKCMLSLRGEGLGDAMGSCATRTKSGGSWLTEVLGTCGIAAASGFYKDQLAGRPDDDISKDAFCRSWGAKGVCPGFTPDF